MAIRTKNLGLIKPDLDDNIDVTQLNANSDILDDKVQTNANNIEAVKQELPKYLPLTGGTLTGDLQTANINVGGHVYKTTNDGTLIIGGGVDYDNGATLDLCGNSRADGVYARLHCGDNSLQVSSDGNTYIGGNNALVNGDGDNIKVSTKTGVAVEVNNDNTVYVSAEKIKGKLGSELLIQSPNGSCNLALNNDGGAWWNGVQLWKGNLVAPTDSNIVRFRYYKLNDYDILLRVRVWNTTNSVDTVSITFPIPFINNDYTVMGNMRSTISGVRINGDYRTAVGDCTATGLTVGRDNFVETELLIIGRIK